MKKVMYEIWLVVGTFIGSGFASGREILVFFSRFGNYSYITIFLCVFALFLLILFFLTKGSNQANEIQNSGVKSLIMLFVCLVFASSMFAGMNKIFADFGCVTPVLICAVLIFCIICTHKGIKSLEKINYFCMPGVLIVFFVMLVLCVKNTKFVRFEGDETASLLLSIVYFVLYIFLNMSTFSVIISKSANGISKKEAIVIATVSCAIILLFLLFGNFVLLNSFDSFSSDMPFLYLCQNLGRGCGICMAVVIFFGCITTCLSLCITLKVCFGKFINNKRFCTFLAVFLPFFVSFFGFLAIVDVLYPISAVLGGVMLVENFFIKKSCHNVLQKPKN